MIIISLNFIWSIYACVVCTKVLFWSDPDPGSVKKEKKRIWDQFYGTFKKKRISFDPDLDSVVWFLDTVNLNPDKQLWYYVQYFSK